MRVGEYVRTKKGYIAKYKGIKKRNNIDGESEDWFIFDSTIIDDYGNSVPVEINKSYFIKSSPNIIDLIEVGDYVNGYYVEDIRHRYDGEMITILEVATGSNYFQTPMYEDDIKSIVTKEMFEQIEYRIGE